jgi:FMN phosphatase YigB (HAD superfamily)
MVKLVYFDVGGVAIKDFSGTKKWDQLNLELGITLDKKAAFDDLYNKYDSQINTTLHINDFYKIVQKELKIDPLPNFDILKDGFVNRFEPNQSLWPIIEEIHKTNKIGLLTNMWVGMLDQILDKRLLPDIKWDFVVDSSKTGLQKPNADIFDYATKLAGVNKNEILFTDNSQKHIEGAKKFGWQTFYYNSLDYDKSSKDLLAYYKSL